MEKYTIYCTEEQTRKAFELGAPIKKDASKLDLLYCVKLEERDSITGYNYWLIPPTAEQMIGWLEDVMPISEEFSIEQIIVERYFDGSWNYFIGTRESEECYSSRKEATLAAIDDAIDYLTRKKGGAE